MSRAAQSYTLLCPTLITDGRTPLCNSSGGEGGWGIIISTKALYVLEAVLKWKSYF